MPEEEEPLWDFIVRDGTVMWRTEQPYDKCPCDGFGWLGKEWLYRRESQCDCGNPDPDFNTGIHPLHCDAVPCPFCPLEASDA